MNNDVVDPHLPEAIFQKKRSPIQSSQEDNAIQDIVLESSWFKASRSLCAYMSCPSLREVDTSRIILEILSNQTDGLSEISFSAQEGNRQMQKELYVPQVEDTNSNMKMLKISSVKALVANSMNILEPPY